MEIDVTNQTPEPEENSEDLFVEYSNKIVGALQSKVKEYNKENKNKKTNIRILKKVFRNAAIDYTKDDDTTRTLWSMARVNAYLGLASGDLQRSFDISAALIPSKNDTERALEDVKKFDLDFDFNNIDDLYLDEYRHFGINY